MDYLGFDKESIHPFEEDENKKVGSKDDFMAGGNFLEKKISDEKPKKLDMTPRERINENSENFVQTEIPLVTKELSPRAIEPEMNQMEKINLENHQINNSPIEKKSNVNGIQSQPVPEVRQKLAEHVTREHPGMMMRKDGLLGNQHSGHVFIPSLHMQKKPNENSQKPQMVMQKLPSQGKLPPYNYPQMYNMNHPANPQERTHENTSRLRIMESSRKNPQKSFYAPYPKYYPYHFYGGMQMRMNRSMGVPFGYPQRGISHPSQSTNQTQKKNETEPPLQTPETKADEKNETNTDKNKPETLAPIAPEKRVQRMMYYTPSGEVVFRDVPNDRMYVPNMQLMQKKPTIPPLLPKNDEKKDSKEENQESIVNNKEDEKKEDETDKQKEQVNIIEQRKAIFGQHSPGYYFHPGYPSSYGAFLPPPYYESRTVPYMYQNQKKVAQPSVIPDDKYKRKSVFIQHICCISGCDNEVSNRTRFCLKNNPEIKKGFFEAGLDKICDQCYFKDRYQYKKDQMKAQNNK